MSKAERRSRRLREREQRRTKVEHNWTCKHGDEWPAWTPIGLCGCLKPGAKP